MSLPAPFGKYELLEQIGTGGMAEVFLARAFGVAGFEKRLVIKRIRPEHARDPRFVSLFINEAKIGVHLNHPNIVAVYELGKVGESYYIAMEHLHGRDLNKVARAYRAQERGMAPGLATTITAEICRGLAHAHGTTAPGGTGMALVHRDISPHNIFVTFTGAVKIVDFGIARLLDRAADPTTRAVVAPRRPGGGKYAYMSPEQAQGEPVDHRTDLFSTGIVLWELLTGAKLYQGSDPEEKLRKVQAAEIPRPDEVGSPVDDDLWNILQRALAKHPEHRYQSAEEFEEDLRAWRYAHHAAGGAAALGAHLRELFPEASEQDPAAPDLRRLADDIARLDAPDTTLGTISSEPTTTAPTDVALDRVLQAGNEERKRVVVLVVDVDGFTDLSFNAEPEVLFKRHLQFLRWLREVVDAHGGTVQRAHDDQIYVFFGVPKTRSDDLRRALHCALDLQRRVLQVRDRGLPLELAIGVHTGEITTARSPSTRLRYMARGNTTRLARRLSEQADHQQIVVSQAVFQAAEGIFQFERGPWLLGRGGKPALASYLLEGKRPDAATTAAAPWLKRSDELDLVRAALGEVSAGRGAALLLRGDGGSGKSRLVRELTALAERRKIPAFIGHAGPFGRPFEILRDLMRRVLGLGEDSPAEEIGHQVERLRQLDVFQRDLEVLAHLLQQGDGHIASSDAWNAVRRVLHGLGSSAPLVVVFEDVQHLAPTELAALGGLTTRLRDRPLLFLLTLQGPIPPALSHARVIQLGPFPPSLQRRHVAHLLGARRVEPELRTLVERTCEGNPLYIEELIKFLITEGRVEVREEEARLLGDHGTILPGSLAGLISARIDALDPGAKGALQIAAVIGHTFSLKLLGEVIGIDDPFPIAQDLSNHGLIHRTEASDAWTFASDFVREAALRGILGVQRRDYHRLVADALERHIGDNADGWSEILAEHCGRGGRPLDAARYAYAAGKRHEAARTPARALSYYQSGLQWIKQADPTPDTHDARVQGETMLRLRLGAVHLLVGDSRAGLRSLHLALDVANEASLSWLEAQAHLELGLYHLHSGDLRVADAHLGQARAIATMERDTSLERDVLEANAQLAFHEGRLDEALERWESARRYAAEDPNAIARCLLGLATVHLRMGRFDRARPLLDEALTQARATVDRILEGRILNNIGMIHVAEEDFDAAVRSFRKAIQVREGMGYLRGAAVNHHNIGDVHFIRGDLSRAYVSFRRARDLAEEIGWTRGVAMNEVYLAFIDAQEQGETRGLQRIDEAVRVARDLGDVEIAVSGAWLGARLLAARGDHEEARHRLLTALEEARRLCLAQHELMIQRALHHLPPAAGTPEPSP
jgi:serine/threonine protein kinase/tetratricopeptide (TPR) repeat protein